MFSRGVEFIPSNLGAHQDGELNKVLVSLTESLQAALLRPLLVWHCLLGPPGESLCWGMSGPASMARNLNEMLQTGQF